MSKWIKYGLYAKAAENVVAIDLIKMGWNIFFPYSPTNPFDILAIKNGRWLRIEVKSSIKEDRIKHLVVKNPDGHDVLAVVCNLTEIKYTPSPDVFNANFSLEEEIDKASAHSLPCASVEC